MLEQSCLWSTTIAFILLFLYYFTFTPSYVIDKHNNERSIRLCTIYAMLYASSIGILVLLGCYIYYPRDSPPIPKKLSVESPTFANS